MLHLIPVNIFRYIPLKMDLNCAQQGQVEKREILLQTLAEVKAMHAATTDKVSATTQKILRMTEFLNTPGSGMYGGM
jgi:hypothetical protein